MTNREDGVGVGYAMEGDFQQQAMAAIFEQAPCLVFLKDLQGRYLLANRRFREAFRLTGAQILGRTDEEVFPVDQAREFRQQDLLVLGDLRPRSFRERSNQDQGERINLVEKFPVCDAQGNVIALAGIVTDVTEGERDRLALEDSEERFRLFTENGLTFAWMKDADGRYVYVSPSVGERTGIPAASRLGRRTDDVVGADAAASLMANDREVLETGRSLDVIEDIVWPTGVTQTWYVHKFLFRDRYGARFIGGVAVDISARVRLEKVLRQQLDRFILPAFGSRIGSHDRDLAHDTLYISSGVAQLLGLGDNLLTWRAAQWRDVIHPDDVAMNAATLQDHLDGKTDMVDMEYRVRHADGGYRWVRSLGAALRDERGRPSRVIGTLIDITEQKQAQAREAAQQRLTTAMARIQHTFLELNDPRSTFDAVLRETLALTGSEFGLVGEVLEDERGARFLRARAVSDSLQDAGKPDFAGGLAAGVEIRALDTLSGKLLNSHQPVICNDPAPGLCHCGLPPRHPPLQSFLGLPLSKRDGLLGALIIANRPGGYDHAMIDYLEPLLATCANILTAVREQAARQTAEAALREQEQRFRLLVEMSPDAVLLSQDGRFVFANPAALRMLDVERFEDLRDLDALGPLEPQFRGLAAARMRQTLSDGSVMPRTEMRIRTLKGAIKDIEAMASRAVFEGRPAVQAVWRDITERKRAHERVVRSRRMESLGTLAGGVAHDFNNILSAIRINTDLALEDPTMRSHSRECLDQVKLASERATALVRQILGFARASTEKREPVLLTQVVQEVLGMLRATIPAMIELRAHLEPEVPLIKANAGQIHQVVINLIMNAIHAIGRSQGHIDVTVSAYDEASTDPGDGPQQGTQVRLRVADDGCGMDEHMVERIYDPFFTTKAPGEGVGLGLSVVHEIVRTHEGRIEVSSGVGQGTCFDLYFPLTREPMAKAQSLPPRPHGTGLRVLFLDDDPLVNFASERMLSGAGYRVSALLDPFKALDALHAQPDGFDVLLVDMAMPGMNGLDFARAARACRRDLPIVLASGYFEPADEYAAREMGITQLVVKPYDMRRLALALARACG